MWYGHGMGWGGMLFGGVFMLLLWGGLLALIFWAVKTMSSNASFPGSRSHQKEISAREILDQRYASGEIDREEYELIKSDISSS